MCAINICLLSRPVIFIFTWLTFFVIELCRSKSFSFGKDKMQNSIEIKKTLKNVSHTKSPILSSGTVSNTTRED